MLKETHANYAEEADRANKYAVESLSSKQVEQLLEEDHTNVGKRSIFRLAIRFIRNSDREMNTLQTAIEFEQRRDGLDEETKRLARLALDILTEKAN